MEQFSGKCEVCGNNECSLVGVGRNFSSGERAKWYCAQHVPKDVLDLMNEAKGATAPDEPQLERFTPLAQGGEE